MMRFLRPLACLLAAIAVVVAMLVVGLELFYDDLPAGNGGPQSFEVHYLTPEEAARLLGADVAQFRKPRMLAPPPADAPGGADEQARPRPD